MKSKVVLLVLAAASGWAQTATPPPAFTPAGDPGVSRAVLIDQPEIRVLRVAVEPGATRKQHTHTDVQYHLFVVITGKFEVAVESDAPVEAAEGRTFFFKPGTKHGFKNTGSTKAEAMEIFVRQNPPR
jgi:quercetin dioxygenase-like cupin family protein